MSDRAAYTGGRGRRPMRRARASVLGRGRPRSGQNASRGRVRRLLGAATGSVLASSRVGHLDLAREIFGLMHDADVGTAGDERVRRLGPRVRARLVPFQNPRQSNVGEPLANALVWSLTVASPATPTCGGSVPLERLVD